MDQLRKIPDQPVNHVSYFSNFVILRRFISDNFEIEIINYKNVGHMMAVENNQLAACQGD
jgi:hypothetical protein